MSRWSRQAKYGCQYEETIEKGGNWRHSKVCFDPASLYLFDIGQGWFSLRLCHKHSSIVAKAIGRSRQITAEADTHGRGVRDSAAAGDFRPWCVAHRRTT